MKLFFISLAIMFAPLNNSEWELRKDQEGVKLYTRIEAGQPLKAIKVETVFNVPLETCVAVLRDIDHLTELFPDVVEVKKIRQDETSQVHYMHMKAPWPVADRDGAFGFQYAYDAKTQTATIEASMVTDAYPEQSGLVRLNKGRGTWKFKRVSATQTSLEYYFLGDPGGKVPGWLANTVIEESPFKMIQNFHKLVKLERYQGKTFGFIK